MDIEVLNRAIGAHGQWKAKLTSAIAQRGAGLEVATVSADNQCEFGRWLSTGAALDASGHGARVKKLHAEFHRVAGKVTHMVKLGQAAQAEEMMKVGGAFFSASAELTMAMMAWKKAC